MSLPISLGLDFGTESVRAILLDAGGTQRGLTEIDFPSGQITEVLPGTGERLPPRYALQDPDDWIDSASSATREVLMQAGVDAANVVGIGVAFTSCTMLPTLSDGVPLCQVESLRDQPLAWPKLWKHHGALQQAERMNVIAEQRKESFLKRYGGIIGLEWLFPKILETIEHAPQVAEAAEVWLEAGDWLVWRLVGGPVDTLTRSTCQAGYKAMWSAAEGYPCEGYFAEVHPQLADVVARRLPGVMRSPGQPAGGLTAEMAQRFALRAGTPVATAIIDAHAAVPGVGAADPGTLVMVLGTSACHMLNASHFVEIPGVAGIVAGGILPDLYGYETGQAAVGDAFAWLLRMVNQDDFEQLASEAMDLPPGAEGVTCMDWMNGCRTPLMNGSLRGAFLGLGLEHRAAHLYLALMEASAYGLRWIVELLIDGGVPINRLIATGGLPHHNRAIVEIDADVLGMPIEIHPSTQGPAVGASVLGMIAAGEDQSGFPCVAQAATAMAGAKQEAVIIHPRRDRHRAYQSLYQDYRRHADALRSLSRLKDSH